MFKKKMFCPKCDLTFKSKVTAKFCPKCGSPIAGGHSDIAVIVDRSGSMSSCHAATVTGFNRFLSDQKALPGTASLTLVQFDNEYEVLADRKPLGEVSPVDATAFTPRGGTALFDAIGRTLAMIETKAGASPCVVCIITDGQENASKECTQQQVLDMIRRLESKGWGFVYLGANPTAFSAGVKLGFQNVAQYSGTPLGTERMYAVASNNVRSFRTGGVACLNTGFSDSAKSLIDDGGY